MFEQDYIMRQIKQLANALEQVLFKKRGGKQQEALDIIKQSLTELPETDSDDFQKLTLEEAISSVTKDEKLNAELAWIVADLLFEQGELTQSRSESQKCYLQALLLYKKAMEDAEVAFPLEAAQKIKQIEEELDSAKLKEVNQLLE